MAQRRIDAAIKDVRIKLSKEECASGTVHRRNDAAVKDARTKLSKEEEFALGMVQRKNTNDAT
jgi:hypothetical protein